MLIESWLLEHPVNMPLKNSRFPGMLSTLNVHSQSIMLAAEAWEQRNVKCIGVCHCWCRCLHQCNQTMLCGVEAAHWPLGQELTPWPSKVQQEVFPRGLQEFLV